MSSATKLADEYADIARRLKEIEAEKKAEVKTEPIGEAAIGWPFAASTDVDLSPDVGYVC